MTDMKNKVRDVPPLIKGKSLRKTRMKFQVNQICLIHTALRVLLGYREHALKNARADMALNEQFEEDDKSFEEGYRASLRQACESLSECVKETEIMAERFRKAIRC